jgi:hypothetical protein
VLALLRDNSDAHGDDVPQRDRVSLLTLPSGATADRLPGHREVVGAVVQVLPGHHLSEPVQAGITYQQWGGSDRWAITDLGRACLARLEQV